MRVFDWQVVIQQITLIRSAAATTRPSERRTTNISMEALFIGSNFGINQILYNRIVDQIRQSIALIYSDLVLAIQPINASTNWLTSRLVKDQ